MSNINFKKIIYSTLFIFAIVIFYFTIAQTSRFYVLETNKTYSFTINYSNNGLTPQGMKIEIERNNLIVASSSCTLNDSCNIDDIIASLNANVSTTQITGILSTKNIATSVTTTVNFYLKNNANQYAFIDYFSFIVTSSLSASITSTAYYNTSTRQILISGNPASTTILGFYDYNSSIVTSSILYYITSSAPLTDVATTSADVRKVNKYAIFWESSGIIPDSCTISFIDDNNNSQSSIIFNPVSTTGLILASSSNASTTFYGQKGEYQISCKTNYAECTLNTNDNTLNCTGLTQDKISTVLINKNVIWYRCFYGFCIQGVPGKTPREKYTFPTYQDCTQKCYLDIKEIAP